MKCQLALSIFEISEKICGGVLMLKNEVAKVSEFLKKFRKVFEQENDFWFKFEGKHHSGPGGLRSLDFRLSSQTE